MFFPREERTHQLVVQCQMISLENIHTSKIVQVLFRKKYMNVCEYVCVAHAVQQLMREEAMNLKESKEGGYMGRSGGRNQKGKAV